jgi:hypothetical protein
MRGMLSAGTYGNDQSRVPQQGGRYVGRSHFLEAEW